MYYLWPLLILSIMIAILLFMAQQLECYKPMPHLTLDAACCAASVAAAQHLRRQHSGPAGCCRAFGPAVGYEHALPTPLFRSEHGDSPSKAANDAGLGARMQIGMAMQEPARIPGPQIRSDIHLDIQLDKWDMPLDMFGSSVG